MAGSHRSRKRAVRGTGNGKRRVDRPTDCDEVITTSNAEPYVVTIDDAVIDICRSQIFATT